jgi:hypothetical protein
MVRQFKDRQQMNRKGMNGVRAALRLIAAENINALRGVRKNVANRLSKSACMQKKA